LNPVDKGVKNGSHEGVEKLPHFDLIMATQASDFCCSFYNDLVA